MCLPLYLCIDYIKENRMHLCLVSDKMSLEQKFTAACDDVKKFSKKAPDQEMLQVYSLFKQATVGDVNIPKPSGMDLKGKSKWDAWNSLKGVDSNTAKERYVEKVKALVGTYS